MILILKKSIQRINDIGCIFRSNEANIALLFILVVFVLVVRDRYIKLTMSNNNLACVGINPMMNAVWIGIGFIHESIQLILRKWKVFSPIIKGIGEHNQVVKFGIAVDLPCNDLRCLTVANNVVGKEPRKFNHIFLNLKIRCDVLYQLLDGQRTYLKGIKDILIVFKHTLIPLSNIFFRDNGKFEESKRHLNHAWHTV